MEKELKTVEEIYNDFWKNIVEKDGVIDMEQVKKELADFHFMLQEVPKVYEAVTHGRISKTNTYAFEVIREVEQAEKDSWMSTIYDDIKMLAKEFETKEELMEELEEYFAEE